MIDKRNILFSTTPFTDEDDLNQNIDSENQIDDFFTLLGDSIFEDDYFLLLNSDENKFHMTLSLYDTLEYYLDNYNQDDFDMYFEHGGFVLVDKYGLKNYIYRITKEFYDKYKDKSYSELIKENSPRQIKINNPIKLNETYQINTFK